jgi:hypothetical protein
MKEDPDTAWVRSQVDQIFSMQPSTRARGNVSLVATVITTSIFLIVLISFALTSR